MLSSGTKCYHLGWNFIIWDEMLSSGVKFYHLELMLSSWTNFYHLGWNVIIWDAMLSSGVNVIIWDKMLSCGANVVMLLFGANVIIWCYRVMLSSGMITPPYFIFPENFTHSYSPLLPSPLFSGSVNSPPLLPFPVWISILYTRIECVRGCMASGPHTDKRLPQSRSLYRPIFLETTFWIDAITYLGFLDLIAELCVIGTVLVTRGTATKQGSEIHLARKLEWNLMLQDEG